MDSNTFYQHDPNIVTRVIAEEMILIPLRKNVGDMDFIYTLNETAARIWKLMDGDHSTGEVCQLIINEFDIEQDQAEKDLNELIVDLKEIGAIVEK